MSVIRKVSIKTVATPDDWAEARAKALRSLEQMTPEEDAAITADAMSDPDNPPISDFANFLPWAEFEARDLLKMAVPIDRDIVERFQKSGDDWERRMNDALRAAAPAE